MADTGKNASFSFNGTKYDETDCIQGFSLNDAINEVVYQCNGLDKGIAGTRSATFQTSLALAKTDTAKVSALEPGNTGAFECHPAGDTATYIEIVATDSLVVSAPMNTGPNAIVLIDVTIRLQDITKQAAS